MSLERPLTLKYIDAPVLKKIQDESGVKETYEEKAVDEFLDSL